MIVFIIPFVSKQNSLDWEVSTKLLQGTIDSLANQNSQNFKVIISCHDIPEIALRKKNDNFKFLQMDYSPQDKLYQGKPRRDRMVKVCKAVSSLKNTDFKYCMSLDADDRIHYNLVNFLCHQPPKDAYIIDYGYQVDYISSRVFRYDHLSDICGSTIILSKDLTGVPKDNSFDEFKKCFWFSKHHDTAKSFFDSSRLEVETVPFKALQYVLNTKINLSNEFKKNSLKEYIKKTIKFWILGRRMTIEEQKQFGYCF